MGACGISVWSSGRGLIGGVLPAESSDPISQTFQGRPDIMRKMSRHSSTEFIYVCVPYVHHHADIPNDQKLLILMKY